MSYPGNEFKGWMTPKELQWLYEMAQDMRSVVEVGSFQGRSTHALLSGCPGPVWVVDNWAEPVSGEDPEDSFKQFCRNLQEFEGRFTILRVDSVKAAKAFLDRSIDMVFIDAGHLYYQVMADLASWTPKAVKMICGHDYSDKWPGVKQAVQDCFKGGFEVIEAIWAVRCKNLP